MKRLPSATHTLATRICIALALILLSTSLYAQKRKTRRSKKSRPTAVVKRNTACVLPVDSLIGKVYAGKVGQTVVDFFGTRTTYGDVTQQIYIWRDSLAVLNQRGGDTDSYLVLPYTLKGSTLNLGQFSYTTVNNGDAIEMVKTKENNEVRQGTLNRADPSMMVSAIFQRGKYLDRITIQTDEDKRDAFVCLSIAAEAGNKEAQKYLVEYYKKRADKGEKNAIMYMMRHETETGNYTAAHEYCDKLIEMAPENMELLCEKGSLYLLEGKKSDAKKIYRRIKKLNEDFYNSSQLPFMREMREQK